MSKSNKSPKILKFQNTPPKTKMGALMGEIVGVSERVCVCLLYYFGLFVLFWAFCTGTFCTWIFFIVPHLHPLKFRFKVGISQENLVKIILVKLCFVTQSQLNIFYLVKLT